MSAVDAWDKADPTLCDARGRESCEACIPAELDTPPSTTHADRERLIVTELERARARREARRRLDAEECGAIALPDLETLRDRLARPVPVTRWRIQGWQPRDARVILAAQFKAGKTTLIGNLLRSLVDGDPWLARDPVEPISGAAVLFDFEMSPAQLDTWLRAQQVRATDRVLPVPMRGRASTFNLLDDGIRARWSERLRGCGATYLVLDCLRPVLDALGLDEHSEAGRFLVAFDALLAEAGIPEACVVHHMGHGAERARGDSRLRDWHDVEWQLVRQKDDPASPRYIKAYGRDVDQPESALAYQADSRRYVITDGSRQDAKAREALPAVLSVLREGELSGRKIKSALKEREIPRDTVEAALKLGVQTGDLAVRDGKQNAKMYCRKWPVSEVSGECPADSARECPGAYISPDTRTLHGSVEAAGNRSDTEGGTPS